MLENIYNTLMGNTLISITDFLLPVIASILLGLLFALVYKCRYQASKSFVGTLALLPTVVCVVIMAVNGNIGAGVAVAGAFSLVRFRSAPGTASEIGALFIAMTMGLLTGMSFIIYAALFILIVGIVFFFYSAIGLGEEKSVLTRNLRVTIPEDLDYAGLFDDVFAKHTTSHKLLSSKTAGMGSVFKLSYEIKLKPDASEKALMDDIRVKNGNLDLSLSVIMPKEAVEL
ncbi:MAG: DUF4956 domain-containing protein [Clostridiales bacterium]|nr:DUF4956 domain-containing protein [Clostridiales bacterium]